MPHYWPKAFAGLQAEFSRPAGAAAAAAMLGQQAELSRRCDVLEADNKLLRQQVEALLRNLNPAAAAAPSPVRKPIAVDANAWATMAAAADWPVAHAANVRAAPAAAQCPSGHVSPEGYARALERVRGWEEFAPTPLVSLPAVARACGVAEVHAKLEGGRCGLGSFKALGGGLAVDELASASADPAALTVTCASAGNHGMGVAWGARRAGCRCLVYLHAGVGEPIADKMRALGAEVVRVPGNYQDSVDACVADSAAHGHSVVQDVSRPADDYVDIPRAIFQGYAVVAGEIAEELSAPPTHVLVNAGVGGFASALCGHLWQHYGAARPRFVAVEPAGADCLRRSGANGGALTRVPDEELGSIQTGLCCGDADPLSWTVLETGCDDFVTVGDAAVGPSMKLLAAGDPGNGYWGIEPTPQIVGGASAVAGLAALLSAGARPELAAGLGLTSESRVVVVVCEGAVEPAMYKQAVGCDAAELEAAGALV